MTIKRIFTKKGASPYEGMKFVNRVSEVKNPDGSIVFRMEDVQVPKSWSQVATDVLAQKYFRKAGVPQADGSFGATNEELGLAATALYSARIACQLSSRSFVHGYLSVC